MGSQTFNEIYDILRERILTGKYSVKMRLPIEDALITEFDSSRYAVRKAIAQLAKEGLVYSVKGRGVVLLEHTPQTQQFNLALNNLDGLQSLNAERHLDYQTEVVAFHQQIVDQALSEHTAFEVGIPVYAIQRVRIVDGIRAVLDINYFNAQRTPTLTMAIAKHSIYQHFKKNGLKIAVVKRMLRVETATELDKAQLALDDNNCIGNMISIAFNDEGRQFEYTESHFIPNKFNFNELIRN
ncbi:UTRA domain-containing protein [Lactiplantibacillus sp. DA1]|uniref:UTRA domain-containing protein n=1 Tax=Lactiplantibacillus sp. DA1 TaxID=3079857 RepID=UPI00292A6555|nr:UTRA domain-containing protein [Lactiplantibacillus sp. DA1]MDV0430343.1 UTRA domain-containing protein [Lactiplantibacillus sp. DA1]